MDDSRLSQSSESSPPRSIAETTANDQVTKTRINAGFLGLKFDHWPLEVSKPRCSITLNTSLTSWIMIRAMLVTVLMSFSA